MSFVQMGHWQAFDAGGRRKYLTAEERRRFLAAADNMPPETKALCFVLAFTGCRISEALSLTRYQIDTDGGTLTVRTLKRRRLVYRAVPVPSIVLGLLMALPAAPDGRLWTTHRSTAWRRVKQAMSIAAIDGPMATCRGLRHGFGMRAAACGVPLNLIAKWLGHASLAMTTIYLDAVGLQEREFARRMWTCA